MARAIPAGIDAASDRAPAPPRSSSVKKVLSGVKGFDEITLGGLPKGRPTLVYGCPGCGKTLFGVQFIAAGALHEEPGVFLAFEETIDDLKRNMRSLGIDLGDLIARKVLAIEHARVDPVREVGQGDYDLDALFMRLARAIDGVQARRVVIDSLEVLLHRDADRVALRDSFHRLFRWLANRGVTSIVTAEEGDHGRTRHGFEDYVADCVVHLVHRVQDQLSTRAMRVVKYRGSSHGTNEYPFLIDQGGIQVLPLTSIGLEHRASTERVSTGVSRLDAMLGGGFFRGTTVLISGTPGSGKSSLSAHYMNAACGRGERVLAFTFEESPDQSVRNMASIGLDLQHWRDAGLLRYIAARPSMYGLETHLAIMLKALDEFQPQSVVVDPISTFMRAGQGHDAYGVALRLLDALKGRGITAVLTHPAMDAESAAHTDLAISSIIDTWILVQTLQAGGERNRTLYILKSRGMAHSNQLREFVITDGGISLLDVYTGPEGVLTGSMRATREAEERAAAVLREQRIEHQRRQLERRRRAIEAQIADLQAQLAADEVDSQVNIAAAEAVESQLKLDRTAMARRRQADPESAGG